MPRKKLAALHMNSTYRTIPSRPDYDAYEIRVQQISTGAEPSFWYWHLFYNGEKVNGGTAESEEAASGRAVVYRYEHHRRLFLDSHLWDEESGSWLPRQTASNR